MAGAGDEQPSSRDLAEAAGWDADPPGQVPSYRELLTHRWRPRDFSWIRPWPLLASANQVIDQTLSDIVSPRRQRWVAAQRRAGTSDLTIRTVAEDEPRFRFLLLGDPGEADESQYAVVAPLMARAPGTRFMAIVSDVIYPAGDVNDYVDGFYIPYADYPERIYALPGNHDWIDGLSGFMFHFCDAEALAQVAYASTGMSLAGRLARRLWRASSRPERALLLDYQARRPRLDPPQPGPYWAMDAGPIRLVSIDTGVDGSIDREQAQWLLSVSAGDRPKILLTGKPLIVNNRHEPGSIRLERNEHDPRSGEFAARTVDEIVRHAAHNYIATVGGDIHNYQRYRVELPECGREIAYIVSGGGGAFLSATHTLGRADREYDGPGVVGEDEFRCYPMRGDSLLHFTRLAVRMAWRLVLAAAVIAALLGAAGWVLWHATGTTWAIPLVPDGTPRWDAAEIGILVALAACAALAAPLIVLGDAGRALENGGKLAAVAATIYLARHVAHPRLWVIAGAVALPLVHVALRPSRRLFVAALAGVSVLGAVWMLRGTWVAANTGEVLAAGTALLALHLLRRHAWVAAAVVAGIAAALWFGGLAKASAVALALAAVLLLVATAGSRLAFIAPLATLQRTGRRLGAAWAREPTADQAARWLSEHRLGHMAPAREAARTLDPAATPLLGRWCFHLLCPKTRLGRLAQSKFSEIFDTNEAPFFRSFLDVEVDAVARTVTLRCFAATGRARHEAEPPLEDWVTLSFDGRQVAEMAA